MSELQGAEAYLIDRWKHDSVFNCCDVYRCQDNEISREQRRRQRTDKELRDVRSKLDLKTSEHDEVHSYHQ